MAPRDVIGLPSRAGSNDYRSTFSRKVLLGIQEVDIMSIQWNPSGILAVLALSVMSLYLLRASLFSSMPAVFSSTTPQISLRSLLCVSILAAQRGGLEVKKVHDQQTLNSRDKDGGMINPVTDGDLRSHHVMMRTLVDTFPGLKVMSEEHESSLEERHSNVYVGQVDKKTCQSDVLTAIPHDTYLPLEDVQLWIDPLDATQEYTENLLNYVTTMVGIAINGKAIGGVIHKPFATENNEKTFWAWKDQGVSDNLKSPKSPNPPGDSLTIIISRSHSGDIEKKLRSLHSLNPMNRVNQVNKVNELNQMNQVNEVNQLNQVNEVNELNGLNVVPAGGAGYKALEVLAGRANVYLHTTKIKKWDLCAPNGILNALGGKLSTLAGNEIDFTATSGTSGTSGTSTTSTEEGSVNYGGVVAALTDHAHYVQIFSALKTAEMSS